MDINEMIELLDGATGRLSILAQDDPLAEEARSMVMEVSTALGELAYSLETNPVKIKVDIGEQVPAEVS